MITPDPGFRTVLAVAVDTTVAVVLVAVTHAAVDFLATYGDGTCHARRLDRYFLDELRSADPTQAVAALLVAPRFVVPTVSQADVDSAYRANRILSKLSPARTLVLLDGLTPVSVFSLDTASAPVGAETLHWITDLPNDESLMAGRVLLLGSTPWLRTRITSEAPVGGHVSTIDLSTLRDRKISFGLIGENITFRLPGETADLSHVDSDFLDPLGDDASYSVQLVPQAAGDGAVEIEIWFDDDENYPHDQRIEFRIIDAGRADAAPTAAAYVTTPFAVPPEASVWIRWDGDELAYDVDGVTLRHPIAASIGELEGAELLELLKRLEQLAQSYDAASAADLLQLNDGGAALLAFAQLGADLHALVYGRDEHDVSDAVAARAAHIAGLGLDDGPAPRLRIDDERFRLPWELFYDHGYTRQRGVASVRRPESIEDVDVSGFWAHRFRIDHPVARGDSAARLPGDHVLSHGSPRVTPFVNATVVADGAESARLVALNAEFLAGLASRGSAVDPPSTDFERWVSSGSATDILYLYGHGEGATSEDQLGRQRSRPADEQATLQFGAEPLSVAALERAEPSPPHLAGAPLVLLNACKTMQGDLAYSNPFVDLLYRRWRARAVIGGLASLPAAFAVGFADLLMTDFVEGGRQIGECLHATQRELLDAANPYGLLYVLHGRSELQIRKGPTA
jgi:hypothetical protein